MIIHPKQKKGLDLVTIFLLFWKQRKGKMEGSEATLQEEWLVTEVNQGLALKQKMAT